MSYHIHTTDAFVLSLLPRSEGSAQVELLTRDFGFLFAHAQGLRELKSKLRYHVTPYALVHVSLVRGRELWRLTGGVNLTRFDRLSPLKRDPLLRMMALARSLSVPDDPHTNYFELLQEAVDLSATVSDELVVPFELLTTLALIESAGFLGGDERVGPLLGRPLCLSSVEALSLHMEYAQEVAYEALGRIG